MVNGTFSMDKHIPNVLVFPPGTDLHDNCLYEEGKIILQDKVRALKIYFTTAVRSSLANSLTLHFEMKVPV